MRVCRCLCLVKLFSMLSRNHAKMRLIIYLFRIQWFSAVEQNFLKWIKNLVIIWTNFMCKQVVKFYWFGWSCTCLVFECIQQFCEHLFLLSHFWCIILFMHCVFIQEKATFCSNENNLYNVLNLRILRNYVWRNGSAWVMTAWDSYRHTSVWFWSICV